MKSLKTTIGHTIPNLRVHFRRETSFGEESGVPQSCCQEEAQCQPDQVLWDRDNPTIVQVRLLVPVVTKLYLSKVQHTYNWTYNICTYLFRLDAFIFLVSLPTTCRSFSALPPHSSLSRSRTFSNEFLHLITVYPFFLTVAFCGCRCWDSALPAAWEAQTGWTPGSSNTDLVIISWSFDRITK